MDGDNDIVNGEEIVAKATRARVDPAQISALRQAGLNDAQICSALGITEADLVASITHEVVKTDNLGPLMSFTPAQIELARNQIAMEVVAGDTSAARLRAAQLVLNLHSVSAETRYRVERGINAPSIVNNIMLAVSDAQDRKMKQANVS